MALSNDFTASWNLIVEKEVNNKSMLKKVVIGSQKRLQTRP